MKKLILLFSVIALTLFSCSSDDDSSSQDSIIGTWKYFKYFENGVEDTLDLCENLNTLVFSSNGDFSSTFYDDNAGTCEIDEAFTGTWNNEGNGAYSITSNGNTDTQQITFESNTFYFEDTDDNGTPGDTSDDVVYRDVFIRQ